MKKNVTASLIGLLFSSAIFAADTSIYTDDVLVTASRIPQSRESVLADVSVIDREEIERAGQSTLVELLRTLPGVEIESNGGIGQASAIHLRGTSSQSVLVLLDGIRVGSATLGTTAFEEISPEQIERIEVVRGPASSLYGSDAIGGVIQIFTKQGEGKPQLSASVGYGSYNTRQAAASFSGKVEQTRFALNVSSLESDGISALRNQTGPDADRDGYRNLSVSGSVSHEIVQGHEIGIQLYNSFNHTNFDDDFLFHAHQDMIQRGFSLNSRNQILANWESNIKIGQGEDDLNSFGSSFGRSSLRTYQRQYSWLNNFKLPLGTLTLGFDRLAQHVEGNTSFVKSERDDNGYLASYLVDKGAHSFQVSLRHDDNSQFGEHDTGNIGYGYHINEFWRVTGNFGTAFRAPTFNDLYFPFQDFGVFGTYQGNPNLKPETSRNKEISAVYDQGHHRVSATLYQNEIKNLLVCCQGLFNDFPTNVGSATINGLNLAYEGWVSNLHVRASSDFLDPRNDDTDKLLTRRAREHGVLWIGQTWRDWEIGSELIASGKRFDDAANTRKLDGYAIINLTANYKLNPDWSLNARANNILDKEYTLATQFGTPYGTPGANLFVGIRYSPTN